MLGMLVRKLGLSGVRDEMYAGELLSAIDSAARRRTSRRGFDAYV